MTAAPLSFRLEISVALSGPGHIGQLQELALFPGAIILAIRQLKFMRDTLLDFWSSTWTADGFFRTASDCTSLACEVEGFSLVPVQAAPLEFRREGLDSTGFSGLGISGYYAKNSMGGTESDLQPGEDPQRDMFGGIRHPVDVVSRMYLSKDCPRVMFQAPNRYSYTWTIAGENGSVTNFIITAAIMPRGPGKSRIVASLYSNLGNKQVKEEALLERVKIPDLRQLLVRFSPKWLSHFVLHELFDGDAVFLRRQVRG